MDRKYIDKCPRCGGAVIEKKVTEVLCVGGNTAVLRITVGVCQLSGERLYPPEIVRQFEEIEARLERQETTKFELPGPSFQVVLS